MVFGSACLNAADIDPTSATITVLESGTVLAAVRGSWESALVDLNGDGFVDRQLKVDRTAFHAAVTDSLGNVAVPNPTCQLDARLSNLDSDGNPVRIRGQDADVRVIKEGNIHEDEDHGRIVK